LSAARFEPGPSRAAGKRVTTRPLRPGIDLHLPDHIGAELEENLGSIEEVTGYIKIVRSYALLSLRFLKSLKVIGGERLYDSE